MTAPWGKIYVRDSYRGDTEKDAPLLAHECNHVRRAIRVKSWGVEFTSYTRTAGYWLGHFWYALKYLVWIPFRRDEEVDAETYETACRGRLRGSDPTAAALEHHVSAPSLGGWRWPHLTGGDPVELRRDVAEGAAIVANLMAWES